MARFLVEVWLITNCSDCLVGSLHWMGIPGPFVLLPIGAILEDTYMYTNRHWVHGVLAIGIAVS